MTTKKTLVTTAFTAFLFSSLWLSIPGTVSAHCDTLDGPVVVAAKAALEKGDVTPVLKWVKKAAEPEIRELFKKTLSVRAAGKEAKELADRHFFETLVRVHRAGEGAPYTGLKEGAAEPIIQAADNALETGSVEQVVKHISEIAAKGLRARFNRVSEAKKHAGESVEKGREFVEAYVVFTHYVERLYTDAAAEGAHQHGEIPETKAEDAKVKTEHVHEH